VTGPQLTAAIALAVVVVVLVVVTVQPRRIWRTTAEHSKVFWLAWALGAVVIGAVPVAIGGWGWGEVVWLVLWCGAAALQPALVVDLVEVRRQVRRRRRATVDRRAAPAAVPRPPHEAPIHWRAPDVGGEG
jgi:hypothetical protein